MLTETETEFFEGVKPTNLPVNEAAAAVMQFVQTGETMVFAATTQLEDASLYQISGDK